MRLLAGTSGFSYDGWKGPFYPAGLPKTRWLGWYAERLPAVEINNTFYRMPKASVLEGWAAQVGEGFRFALKAPQRITHFQRLRNVADTVTHFLHVAGMLGARLGPLLFQLPPHFKADVPLLREFLALVPAGYRVAVELRHPSWFTQELLDALAARGAALCVSDDDGGTGLDGTGLPDLPATAEFAYLRLRRTSYDDAAIAGWAARLRALPWKEAFVFFKHEEDGVGPRLATRLLEL